jgi:elongation factor Ts
MAISAQDVKKLRDITAAGMMECKKALEEANGDFDQAVEILRISGAAKAAKRGAERSATNGLVAAKGTALIALNCETDFVAKNEDFQKLAATVVEAVAASNPADVAAANAVALANGRTVADEIEGLSAVIGEKLELGNVANFAGTTTVYLHRRSEDLPPQVGVLVEFTGDEAVARATAMQIAAMRPQYVSAEDIPVDVIETEKRIAEATAREEGKPEAAIAKITEGRVNGFIKEVVLLDQASVQDNKKTVRQVLAEANTTVSRFVRFEVAN